MLSIYIGLKAQSIDDQVSEVIEAAEVYNDNRDYGKAIELLENALISIGAQIDPLDFSLVRIYHKLGVNYYYFGKYMKAEENTTIALDIRLEKFGSIHLDVAKGYFSLGSIKHKMRLLSLAERDISHAIYSMESLLRNKQSEDSIRLIRMYDEYVKVNKSLKNNDRALEYWEKSYRYYSKNKVAFQRQIASLFIQKSNIYYNQKKYALAEKNSQIANARLKKLHEQNNLVTISLLTSFLNLTLFQLEQGKYDQARANCTAVINLLQKEMELSDNIQLSIYLGNAYKLMFKLAGLTKEYELCENYFDKSQTQFEKGFKTFYHPRIAELFHNKADINIQQGNYIESLDFNQKSLHALLPTFKINNPLLTINLNSHFIKDKLTFLETITQKATIFTALYNKNQDQKYLQAAFQNYQTLDTVITQVRQSYNAAGSQFELIEQSYPIYEKAISTALILYEKTKENYYLESAYHFAAKNKALVLLGGMQDEQAKSYSSIPPALLDQEKDLKRSIFQLESELYDLGDKGSAQLKDSLFTLRRDYQKLIDKFEVEYADYYASKYGFDKNISIATLQNKLAVGASIIEYFVGDNQIFVFTISKNNFDYVAMDKPVGFEQTTATFRQQLDSQTKVDDAFSQQSFQLYNYLLKASLIKLEGINHLVIIPDGILMQLPFDVLLQEENASIPKYLIRDYSISYAYSNQLLFGQTKQNKAAHVFAGFGLEYDQYTLDALGDYMDNPIVSLPLTRALGKLQYSDDEIQEIAELLGGDEWLNGNATRNAFIENASDYAILHLATHGVLNEAYPMNSALVFTRQNDSTEYFLRAADLYNMQLNADMVVLSACNTGAGIVKKGEGVRSLARAFSYAGCPSMVASLWSASDQSTKEILVDFYKNLKQGMTKAEAMRQAKLTYLDSASPAYQSPFFWSHLNVIGDSSELEVLIPFWKKYWFLGLIGLLLIGGGVVSRRTKTAA